MSDVVLVEREGPLGIITLNRPERRNAIGGGLMEALNAAIVELDADDSIRVLVLTGTDPAFCAGVDLKEPNGIASATIDRDPDQPWGIMADSAKPLIGAINGPAATGGLEIALDCDFLIASDRARFADTHARVGVMAGGGMFVRLPQLIGIDRAMRMSLTGDYIDAATALDWGLVTEVVPHEALMDRAREVAAAIAEIDPVAVSTVKAIYAEVGAHLGVEAYRVERQHSDDWMRTMFTNVDFASRRAAVISRGSTQNR
jgi:enoyl-CoA hydratase